MCVLIVKQIDDFLWSTNVHMTFHLKQPLFFMYKCLVLHILHLQNIYYAIVHYIYTDRSDRLFCRSLSDCKISYNLDH